MKKNLLFIPAFSFSSLMLFAQVGLKPLTVREVFDFNIGDVSEYHYRRESYPNRITEQWWQHKITDKQEFADTIIYTIDYKLKTDEGELVINTFRDTITQLDSSIFIKAFTPHIDKNDPNFKYFTLLDSTYNSSEYGGGIMSSRYFYMTFPLNEPNDTRSFYMQGLGKVKDYFTNIYPQNPGSHRIESELVYYKKGSKTWGDTVDFKIPPRVYRPLVVEGAQWLYNVSLDSLDIVQIKGDSILDGKSYKKVFLHELLCNSNFIIECIGSKKTLLGLIREDVLNEKVYFRMLDKQFNLGFCSPNEDFLLYDFNPQNGDTLESCQFGNDKVIVYKQSTKLYFENKFILPGFYANKLWFYQTLGCTDGLFYNKKYFRNHCIDTNKLCFVKFISKDNDISNANLFLQIINNQTIVKLAYQLKSNQDNFKIKCFNTLGQVIEEQKINILDKNLSFSTPANQLLIYVLFQGEIPIGSVKIHSH